MLHLLFDDQPWFTAGPKGWLCARPVRWQAHLLIAMFLLNLIGIQVAQARAIFPLSVVIILVLFVTAIFITIVARKTRRMPRS